MGLPKEKHHLHIELTAEQYQQLCRQAKLCGLCKRAYIVRLIDGTPIRARPSQEIKDLRTEIHHIGNNINRSPAASMPVSPRQRMPGVDCSCWIKSMS